MAKDQDPESVKKLFQLSQAAAGDIKKIVEGILNKDSDNKNDPFS